MKRLVETKWWMLAAFGAIGCASAQGTNPPDMTVAGHEAAAGQEQQASEQHAEQYKPEAATKTEHCNRAVCWTSVSNPTAQHTSDAAEHRDLAEKHRAAAQALRDAEAKSCAGLDPADRDTSPFYHREDIAEVAKVERTTGHGRHEVQGLIGGKAVFRAVPGMTAEWLQRLVDCHLARAASVGNEMPEMAYCPLMLKGVTATASSTGNGFAIQVTADDTRVAEQIWQRMQALKTP